MRWAVQGVAGKVAGQDQAWAAGACFVGLGRIAQGGDSPATARHAGREESHGLACVAARCAACRGAGLVWCVCVGGVMCVCGVVLWWRVCVCVWWGGGKGASPGRALQAQVGAGQAVGVEEHGQPKVDRLQRRVLLLRQQHEVACSQPVVLGSSVCVRVRVLCARGRPIVYVCVGG